jgi:hypothetical protein
MHRSFGYRIRSAATIVAALLLGVGAAACGGDHPASGPLGVGESASCRSPAGVAAATDAAVAGCVRPEAFQLCSPTGCQDACSPSGYPLVCASAGPLVTPIPAPDSALGCTFIPIPTPSNAHYYCCPCAQ